MLAVLPLLNGGQMDQLLLHAVLYEVFINTLQYIYEVYMF